jgi:hypothetical protein
MVKLLKAIYMIKTIHIKIPMIFITEAEKLTLIYFEAQKTQMAKAILNKKSNAEGITICDFKLYYITIVKKKMVLYWHKTDMKTRETQVPDVNPCGYAYLIFYKSAKNIQWRKGSLFNKCCCKNGISAYRNLKLDLCMSPCRSTNSKWIEYLMLDLKLRN